MYGWPLRMPMLSYLVDACVRARRTAGVSQAEVVRQAGLAAYEDDVDMLFDTGFIARLERGKAGWTPKIDYYVRGYARAAGTTDIALWEAALREYGRAESDRAIEAAMRRGRERGRR